MPLVMVARVFDEPQVFEELQAVEDAHAWCLEENDVKFIRTYFARDRRRMMCLYEAPDADAVRRAQRKAGLPFEKVWPVRTLSELQGKSAYVDDKGRETVVCERTFPIALEVEVIAGYQDQTKWCLEENNSTLIDSYLPPNADGTVCVFAAPDAESIRRANHTVKVPFDRVWAATVHEAPSS